MVGEQGRRQHFVHRLVAAAFIGACPEGHVVAHGDGDRANPRVENLRYATAVENEADKIRHGTQTRGELHPNAVVTEAEVAAIREEYAMGTTQTVLAKRYGTHQTNISLIVREKTRRQREFAGEWRRVAD
jgi:hypothetical protein